MVEVMKGTCCLAVVKDYYGLLKYNARLLALSEEERDAEKARTAMPPKPPPEEKTQEDEEKKQEDEAKKQEDEAKTQEDEAKKQGDEAKKQGDEAKKGDEAK